MADEETAAYYRERAQHYWAVADDTDNAYWAAEFRKLAKAFLTQADKLDARAASAAVHHP